ncbi:MAG TPA: hypothetical protein VIF43_01155 [Patescibacteria group bacterium]|jgi:hypothetical protein
MVFGAIITLEAVPWLVFAAVASMTLRSWFLGWQASKAINRNPNWYMPALDLTVVTLFMLLVVVVFEQYLYP